MKDGKAMRRADASARKSDLLSGLPDATPGEVSDVLLTARGVRLERIVSRGQASPEGFWYDQEEDEWVLLAAGAARLAIEDGATVREIDLVPGATVYLPAGCRHRVAWTDPVRKTVWLALFLDTSLGANVIAGQP